MNNETKHTPEPWHLGVRQADQIVYDKTGWAVANCTVFHGRDDPNGEARSNARRIVACVNACAGTPTEWLEQNRPIYLVGPPASESLEHMRNQRDELAAALRGMLALVDHLTEYPKANARRWLFPKTNEHGYIAESRAALAKATA